MRDLLMTVCGRLGNDPKSDTVNTKNGVKTVARLSVAGNNSFDETIWFSVTLWGKTAEYFLQYARKGDGVFMVGELRPDAESGKPKLWQDKENNMRAQWGLDNLKTCQLIQKGAKDDRQARAVDGAAGPADPPWPESKGGSESGAGFNFTG